MEYKSDEALTSEHWVARVRRKFEEIGYAEDLIALIPPRAERYPAAINASNAAVALKEEECYHCGMGAITVRQLDADTKLRLRIQAAQNGHSMEQEARNILRSALRPVGAVPQDEEPWVDRMLRRMKEIGGEDDFVLEIPPREFAEPRVLFDDDHS
ncbi:MAG: hypothetical protein K2X03_07185 [Bryobacteraceae bacterium]|nr:hypothetical protein [Bryobacteraceae bacterium]